MGEYERDKVRHVEKSESAYCSLQRVFRKPHPPKKKILEVISIIYENTIPET
jgi:hypothetical protein